MKNYPVLLLAFLLFSWNLSAQSLLEGSISNENGKNISAASIKLHHLTNVELTKQMTADEYGYFIMDNIEDGEYWLEISMDSYQTIIIENFQFPKDSDKVMGLTMDRMEQIGFVNGIIGKYGIEAKVNNFAY